MKETTYYRFRLILNIENLVNRFFFVVLKNFLAIITTSCCGYTDFFYHWTYFFLINIFSPEDRKHFFSSLTFFSRWITGKSLDWQNIFFFSQFESGESSRSGPSNFDLFSFFHFIRRFWNQIFICLSVRHKAWAISIRRLRVR